MDARTFIREITAGRNYQGQVVHVRAIDPREPRYAEPKAPVADGLRSLLRRQNIHRLYVHQARAVDLATEGKDFVVVTGTASGKTLCYNLPVVQTLLSEPAARALYLFPTKALTQDQFAGLQRWSQEEELINVLRPAVYDGDTPSHNRSAVRARASVVLTNPDMLHVGMLPYHGKWHEFLRSLRYVVIDELHTYRGIFGSHVACVLRRLLRLCEHYGSRPQVIASSATIANPVELAASLTGRRAELVDDDGSGRGRKYFVLWNPPFLAGDNVSRRSANVEAVELLAELVRRRTQTIVFAKSRVAAELIYTYARRQLDGQGDLAERIRPYRGGYLPGERREIEQELFSGRLLAVSATTALELGIDVGGMDAAVLVGFPGTICSTWQQAGRAGRSSQDSLVILVGYNEPVDQYLMRHPEYLFAASHEHAVIDPSNPHILASQLACACFEKPLSPADREWFGPVAMEVAEIAREEGEMKAIDQRYYWSKADLPHRRVSLRMMSNDTYAISDLSQAGKVIGNVDSISAPELVYPNAVYLHEGRGYLVRELDSQAKVARVEPADVDYYTQPVLASSCRLGEPTQTGQLLDGETFFGPADVTWQTTAFRKVKYYTMELVGQSDLDLPAQTLSTTATWWTASEAMLAELGKKGHNPIEALMGVRNLMLAALPSLAMCDRRDISGMVDSANLGKPAVMVYDRYPGGLGFALQGFELMGQWLEMAQRIVAECLCQTGCPSCVGLPNLRPPIHHDPDVCGSMPVPDKQATLLLLKMLQAAWGG
ncbi:MAG: putative ATP-dependent helicase Lhr [Planctomycetes bacterium ADurb.Bin126]|nr:MAG: putative ATP-dependent helicase Lhr [Planctomycetes bacterium ADurb.Bin126]HOD84279.1 DEAD/DEAH box helicase [Phycisphaerae bacterium]HQL76248.1 DEAD/DEAH box helicase [Phycisphaerae bacterium]